MSVLIEFAMFPTDKGESVSAYVGRIIKMIDAGYNSYKLTSMGTIVEVETLDELREALATNAGATEPLDVLAALGGFEIAMMVGAILVATSKRHLVMIDGIAACAALLNWENSCSRVVLTGDDSVLTSVCKSGARARVACCQNSHSVWQAL